MKGKIILSKSYRLAPRVFSLGFPDFLSPQNQHTKFQFNQDREPACKPAKADVAYSLNIVIFKIILIIQNITSRQEDQEVSISLAEKSEKVNLNLQNVQKKEKKGIIQPFRGVKIGHVT